MWFVNSHKLIVKAASNQTTKDIFVAIQLEKLKAGNMYTGEYSGFTDYDDGLVSLLLMMVGTKLTLIKETIVSNQKDERLKQFVNTFANLLLNRTYAQLILNMREELPQILFYEHAGILFEDKDRTLYFFWLK